MSKADDLDGDCHLWLGRVEFPVGIFGGNPAEVLADAGRPFVVARPA